MKKIHCFLILCVFSLILGVNFSAADNNYPQKAITIIVPFSPGGGADTYIRMVVPYISKQLGNAAIVVKNIPGGDMITGLMKIYHAKPDGYTLGLFMTPGQAVRQVVGGVNYDLSKVTWLGRISSMDYVMALSPKSKFKTLQDLQQADKVILGVANISGAIGTLISCEKLKIKITPLSHRGSQEAILAAIRGDVDVVQFPITTMRTAIKAGDLNPILVFSKKRATEFQNVLTINELGHPELVDIVKIGYYLGGPPNITPSVVDILKKAVEKALTDKELHMMADKVNRPIIEANAQESNDEINEIINSYTPFKKILSNYLK